VSDREALLKQMAAEFPDSAMAHFSLGAFYLEAGRPVDAVKSLERATALQADYAAAWVALGDARHASGADAGAREAYAQARSHAVAQGHGSLAEEIDHRVASLG
jgi:predicted Zn-dependent protease